MRKTFFILIISFLFVTCRVQTEFMVSRPGEEPEKCLTKFVYVLPQTVLHLELTIVKETFIPGPYRNFAPSYLGITNPINEIQEEWDISSVKFKYLTEPDSANYFSVCILNGNPDFSNYLALSSQGLILDPTKWVINYKSELIKYPSVIQPPYFTDLSVSDYFKEITDTLYKTIITDTSFIRIPIPRRQRDAKTLEQKAEDAASFILHLREARFDLLSGEIDSFPGGEALEFAINEINKLENNYLELFTGKKIKQVFTGSAFIFPDGRSQQINLIKYLTDNGIKDLEKYTGEPVVLHITPSLKTFSLNQSIIAGDLAAHNHFIYRIPDVAAFKVMKGNTIVYEERATLYQAGKLVNLPLLD